MAFTLRSSYQPKGDQPEAIETLVRGLGDGFKDQVLLGITGSGKTFTIASVIQRTQRPTLVLAHNKTLAAQLYQEFKSLFPENAVEYFVSYYDYYQPEAYMPAGDVYIEKEAIVLHERGPAEAPDAAIASEVCRTDVNRRSNQYGQVTEQSAEACEDDDGEAWRETGQDHQADEPDVSMPDQPLQEVEPE